MLRSYDPLVYSPTSRSLALVVREESQDEMDAYEVTRMVYSRVQAMEPEAASKIMGFLLLQDQGQQEMLRLALGPDALLQAMVAKAKQQLGLIQAPRLTTLGYSSELMHKLSSPSQAQPQLADPGGAFAYDPFLGEGYLNPGTTSEVQLLSAGVGGYRPYRRPASLSELSLPAEALSAGSCPLSPAWKPCLYFARGYCKHGSNCRFLHSHFATSAAAAASSAPASPSSLLLLNSNSSNSPCSSPDDLALLAPASLDRLELELQELLRGRRAPVSIASLPQLYYEKFGKTLQAEGYLTESQRHGKAGYSLTKLLARLKNTVTLIDRGEKDDLSGVNPGSRQIYLTFPAESTFTEEDVSNYFRIYGPVQDVRIPYQQKRMFGFVTFVYPETVKAILAKGNPHYICGARVLVKPYKEKGKHSEKRLPDRGEHSRFAPSRSFDGREFTFTPGLPFFDDHELLRRQINEQEFQTIELERRGFAGLQFADSPRLFVDNAPPTLEAAQIQHDHVSNELHSPGNMVRTSEDLSQLQASSAFGYLLDVLDGDPAEDLEPQAKVDNDETSDVHNLPDSPFASPRAEAKVKPSSLPDKVNSFPSCMQALLASGGPMSAGSSVNSGDDKDLTCRICMDSFVDPIRLDCNHVFCVQCILKVIRVSKDECPLCQRHIGSQIVKLLENRGLQVIDTPLTKPRGVAASSQVTSW